MAASSLGQQHGGRHDKPRPSGPIQPAIHYGLQPPGYRSFVALMIWLILSVWAFFNRGAYIELTLAMITLFIVILVAIPPVIWMTWQHNAPPEETREPV